LILDTSALVAAERGDLDIGARFAGLAREPFGIAAITASELLHGLERARESRQRARRAAFIDWVLGSVRVHPFGLEEARVHARIWATLAASGATLGAHDLLIAATAIARADRLVTRDARGFGRVPSLAWERW
jgi:predicted nucleic acid-binding protein